MLACQGRTHLKLMSIHLHPLNISDFTYALDPKQVNCNLRLSRCRVDMEKLTFDGTIIEQFLLKVAIKVQTIDNAC